MFNKEETLVDYLETLTITSQCKHSFESTFVKVIMIKIKFLKISKEELTELLDIRTLSYKFMHQVVYRHTR